MRASTSLLLLLGLLACSSMVAAQTAVLTGYYDDACTVQATESTIALESCVLLSGTGATPFTPGVSTGIYVKAWCDTTDQDDNALAIFYTDAACTTVSMARQQLGDGSCVYKSKFTCSTEGTGAMPAFPPDATYTTVEKCSSDSCSGDCLTDAYPTNTCMSWNNVGDAEKSLMMYCNGAAAATPMFFGYSGAATCTDATMLTATSLPSATCKNGMVVTCPTGAQAAPATVPTFPATTDATFGFQTVGCSSSACTTGCLTTATKLGVCTTVQAATGMVDRKHYCGGGTTATASFTRVLFGSTDASCSSPTYAEAFGFGDGTCNGDGALSCLAGSPAVASDQLEGWGSVSEFSGTGADTCTAASQIKKVWMPLNTCAVNANHMEAAELNCDRGAASATWNHYNAESCSGTPDEFHTQATKTCLANFILDCNTGAASALMPSMLMALAAIFAATRLRAL